MFRKVKEISKNSKKRHLFVLILALMIALGIRLINADFLEAFTYDMRIRILPDPPSSNLIEIIKVTEQSKILLKGEPTANDYSQLFRQLRKSKPKVVVLAVRHDQIVGNFEELEQLSHLALKANAYFAVDQFGLPGTDNLKALPPLDKIPAKSAIKSSDSGKFGDDGITRRWAQSFLGNDTLYTDILKKWFPQYYKQKYKGTFVFGRSTQGWIEYRRPNFYPSMDFESVLQGKFSKDRFTNKIVIVGIDARNSIDNYLKTPYSRDLLAMNVTEMHANVFDTVILDRAPIKPPEWVDLLLTIFITVLTVFVVLSLRPTYGLLILLGTLGLFGIVCSLGLFLFQYNIQMSHPLLAILISYYFFIPYRLIQENRRSWEYLQKNTLLTQVEELKTNFMKMMSHDLRTPLARIQGLSDMIISDSNPLSEKQMDASIRIRQSSIELAEFIGTILSLGRIESKNVKLMLQSKDINQLIEEVAERSYIVAEEKNIQILCELEPMFSINFDPGLMKQVFTNLIENAIKYSPKGSKILVTSEESDGKVIVQVADQGYGIPEDEIVNIFAKFYRSKDATTSPIKGSGLGLYLANYFVELHDGIIAVESVVGEGSTFSVEFPATLNL